MGIMPKTTRRDARATEAEAGRLRMIGMASAIGKKIPPFAGTGELTGAASADLLAVLFAFGQTGSGLPEDTNCEGVVDDADLLQVLFNFGQGC